MRRCKERGKRGNLGLAVPEECRAWWLVAVADDEGSHGHVTYGETNALVQPRYVLAGHPSIRHSHPHAAAIIRILFSPRVVSPVPLRRFAHPAQFTRCITFLHRWSCG